MRALLDVNVLIALLDQGHVHHAVARDWLAANIGQGWASCPITQNGCIRIMSQPAYPKNLPARQVAARLAEALAALGDMTMVRRLLTHDLSASQARMATTAGYVITSELDYRRMVEKVGRKIVAEATKKRKSRDEATEADTKPGDRGSGGDRD